MSQTLSMNTNWKGDKSSCSPYQVTFSISPSTGDVQIHVDAPFHDDPAPKAPCGKLEGLHEYEVAEVFISGYPSAYQEETPYLEIQVGPHGHYFLAFFLQEQDWDNVDTSIDFENKPKVSIDRNKMRWKTDISIPSFLLPEPMCGEDLSVCWRVNICAIHGSGSKREFLSHCPFPGEQPNFHQLEHFKEIQLFETLEVRDNVDRTISIATEKIKIKNSPGKNATTVFDITQRLQQAVVEEEESSKKSNNAEEVPKSDIITVEQVARQIRDRLLTSNIPSNLLELEEKYQRQVQSNEFVILHDMIWKRKSLSYRRRRLILTSMPRLFYLDSKGEYRGQVPWTMTKRVTINKVRFINIIAI